MQLPIQLAKMPDPRLWGGEPYRCNFCGKEIDPNTDSHDGVEGVYTLTLDLMNHRSVDYGWGHARCIMLGIASAAKRYANPIEAMPTREPAIYESDKAVMADESNHRCVVCGTQENLVIRVYAKSEGETLCHECYFQGIAWAAKQAANEEAPTSTLPYQAGKDRAYADCIGYCKSFARLLDRDGLDVQAATVRTIIRALSDIAQGSEQKPVICESKRDA